MTQVMTIPGVMDIIKRTEREILELTDVKVSLISVDQYREAFKTVEQVASLVSYALEISIEQMKSKSRKRDVTLARQICMYYADIWTKLNHAPIAEYFNRDRTMVIHSKAVINGLMDINDDILLDAISKINALL